ncbi:MAG TPA: hypothetical protein VD995_24515 [Azospirillum sp.]|nr:hypothetical protein [Azospirillum sp.]
MIARHHPWTSRVGAALGALALLVHVAMAGLHVPAFEAAAQAVQAAVGEHCGQKADTGAPAPAKPGHPGAMPPCPICQSLQLHAAFLAPDGIVLVYRPSVVGRLAPAVAAPVAAAGRFDAFRARAPPAA